MIKTRVLDTYRGKIKIKYDDGTEPSVIGIRNLCAHEAECPLLTHLGKQQLKLWRALQACDMQAVLSMDWVMVYQTLKTFEALGLITYPCEVLSFYQLKLMQLKLIDRNCNCGLTSNTKGGNI